MAHSAVVRADIDPAAPPEARSDLLVRELRSLYRRDLGFATSTAMIGPCLSATFRHPGQSGNWIAALCPPSLARSAAGPISPATTTALARRRSAEAITAGNQEFLSL